MDFCTGKRCVMKGHLFKVLGKLKEIAIYLSNDDWTELSEWVESRYKKVQQNCENMLAVEVRLLKPQFKNEDTKKTKKENTRKLFALERFGGSANEEPTKETESRRCSLGNRERIVYAEERELCDDDYLFCEDCETFFIEECPVHGPPVFIKDTVVEFSGPDRACLTLPEGLSIVSSKIRNAGFGV
ncbi:histone-lysine N-methyltransferase PRDM9-like isoform X2 [Cetorhinus maximus]